MLRGRIDKCATALLAAVGLCALLFTDSAAAGDVGADVMVSDLNGMTTYGTVMTCSSHRTECESDADCNACSVAGSACMGDEDCPPGETCVISGDACDVEMAAFSVRTVSCNVGDVQLKWCDSEVFPICVANEHPVIAQNMYRLHEDRFEQIGMAWVKHGFAALDEEHCGPCTDAGTPDLLGIGCSDTYGSDLNGSQARLGPRSEVNPNTGVFPYPYTLHQDETGDTVFKRLQVHTVDLMPALNSGAAYFFEGHYVTADDAAARNGNNNASHQEITISGPNVDGFYLPATAGGTVQGLPAIRAWKERDPLVVETDAQVPGEGLFILSGKATLLITGFWRYEYALYNMNSDRAAGSFFVPLPLGAVVENVGFHDVDYHSDEPYDGTDWSATVTGAGITWSTESHAVNANANALRWSTLYNFRFETNAGPDPALNDASIGLFKPGQPVSIGAASVTPQLGVLDCNDNGIADSTDISQGTSNDCDSNTIPDECQPDCNSNQTPDACDMIDGTSNDCNINTVPDECEVDCDGSGRPDACDIDPNGGAPGGPYFCTTDCDVDCNTNGVPDGCDPDCNENGVADGCYGDPLEPDTDGDGVSDCIDLCRLTSPPEACDCPPVVCCEVAGFPPCTFSTSWFVCIDFYGGTPACMPSDLCRNGCLIGDSDDNGILDLRDWGTLQSCFSGASDGPGFSAPSPACLNWLDYDADGDVDASDVARWYAVAYP